MFICRHLLLRAWEAGTPFPSCIVQLSCFTNHPTGKLLHQELTVQVDVYPLPVVVLGMFGNGRARALPS